MRVLLLCFALSATTSAQQNAPSLMPPVEAHPKAHFVTNDEWPLKWVQQTFTEDDQLQELVLQNTSNRTLSGFQLAWIVFVPDGCGVTEAGVPRRELRIGPYETRNVKPGETVTVGPYHFSTDSISTLARRVHSPAIFAQIGLYRVRYGDGGETISAVEQLGAFGPEAVSFPCQTAPQNHPDRLHTFSENSAFQFQYSDMLIHCVQKKDQGEAWIPADSCNAYFPVCDDSGSQGSSTLACFAYPKDKFADTPTFEAAAFSVAEVRQARTEDSCLVGSPDWDIDPRSGAKIHTINEVKFKFFEIGGAGMSQGVDGQVYRTFRQNKCYQLSIRLAMANSGAFDPGTINKFSKEDENEVRTRLRQCLNSFRFVK